MRIQILKPGLLSTIQDLGRTLYRSQAVPVSGAMDCLSARIANKAIGNEDGAAVIEFTFADAAFKAETDLLIAYAGDSAILFANSKALPPERPIFIPAGTIVKLKNHPSGCRTYLAIAGGFNVPEVLGSKSTYLTARFGGLDGRKLQTGDVLSACKQLTTLGSRINEYFKSTSVNYPLWSIARTLLLPANRQHIRVVPAREFTWFNSRSIIDFLSTPYTLGSRNNRMGYHLEGAPVERLRTDELLSTAVSPGTLQVTGNGSMVLLMADCQTTGGYPRIGQVAAVDLPLCGQLKAGDQVYFKEISGRDAEELYLAQEQQLHQLTSAIKNKFGL